DDRSTRDAHLRIDPQVGRAFQAGLRREPPRSAESPALPVQPRATGTAPRYRYSPALQLWLRGGHLLLHLERFRFHRIQLLPLQQLIDRGQLRLHRRIELRQLFVEAAAQRAENGVRLFGRRGVGAFDDVLQRRDLVVQLDREVERILAALQLRLIDLVFHRAQRLLEIVERARGGRRLRVQLPFAIDNLLLD